MRKKPIWVASTSAPNSVRHLHPGRVVHRGDACKATRWAGGDIFFSNGRCEGIVESALRDSHSKVSQVSTKLNTKKKPKKRRKATAGVGEVREVRTAARCLAAMLALLNAPLCAGAISHNCGVGGTIHTWHIAVMLL